MGLWNRAKALVGNCCLPTYGAITVPSCCIVSRTSFPSMPTVIRRTSPPSLPARPAPEPRRNRRRLAHRQNHRQGLRRCWCSRNFPPSSNPKPATCSQKNVESRQIFREASLMIRFTLLCLTLVTFAGARELLPAYYDRQLAHGIPFPHGLMAMCNGMSTAANRSPTSTRIPRNRVSRPRFGPRR